jgi:hypothetical protein
MNERELKLKLEEKKREMQAIETEYLRMRSARQLDTFVNELLCSSMLLDVITTEKLTADDCKIFAAKIGASLTDIFESYAAEDVHKNQLQRSKKNQKRKRKDAEKSDSGREDLLNDRDANMTEDDSCSVEEAESLRTY